MPVLEAFTTIVGRIGSCRSKGGLNGYAPAISRRGGQVVVVSPFPFQAAFDCALSSTVRETPHPVAQGLLPGSRPFHHIPVEPPGRPLHRPTGLCRFCSGARTLARRAPTRPRVSRRGDFPQRPAVAGAVHRQLPSTSWRWEQPHRAEILSGGWRSRERTGTPRPATGPGGSETASVVLMPSLVLRRGRVCRPGPAGPEDAVTAAGIPPDPFDVIDRIVRDYSLLYLVDLDGIESGEPQFDYIQEFSRDIDLWVDAGVRNADQSIDVLVAGAKRAVVSSGMLEGPEELERAWGLSTELVFEIPFEGGKVRACPEWHFGDAAELARSVRKIGVGTVILSPATRPRTGTLVRTISAGGPTWVDGTFDPGEASPCYRGRRRWYFSDQPPGRHEPPHRNYQSRAYPDPAAR